MSTYEAFRREFKGDLVAPGDPDYSEALARWSNNAIRKAKLVAFVKDSRDVSLAIKYATSTGLPIAIRGGGHSVAGSSSREDGFVIDLSKYLNGARVDPEKKLIFVCGGTTWATVDKAAIEHGLATVGGTVNHTGVGGLILGGGYGWLSGTLGLSIDNLVQATIVTADGSILTASASENPDLFWGIRGGGSNFGVATEFVLKLHPQRRTVFGGQLVFSADKAEGINNILVEWWPKIDPKEGIYAAFTRIAGQEPCIILILFYNGSEAEGRKNFEDLYKLGPLQDNCTEIPFEDLNGMMHAITTYGLNYYMKGFVLGHEMKKTFIPECLKSVIEVSKDSTHNYTTIILEFVYQGKVNSVPEGETPFPRNQTGNIVAVVQWGKDDDSPEKLKSAKNAVNEISKLMPKGGGYSNYSPDSDTLPKEGIEDPNKTQNIFKDNYPRLQAIKRKYDPNVVFDKWFVVDPTPA